MVKSQSALEYLIVVALAFIIIMPATYFFFNYSKESSTRMVDYRANSIGKTIIKSAESIYYSGEHSKTVIDVDMPPNINNMYIISNRELVFNATFENENSELVFFSQVNITGGKCSGEICAFNETLYSSGLKHIKIESISGDQVSIEHLVNT